MRFGRGARIASLEQDPVLPPGTVREYLGDWWEVAAVATQLGVQPLFDRRTDELSGGQAKRVALARMLADDEHGDARHDRARRADQPPRPRSDRVARVAPRVDDRGAGARHPRPPRPRSADHCGRAEQGRRTRSVVAASSTRPRPDPAPTRRTSMPVPNGSSAKSRRSRRARSSPARSSPGCAGAHLPARPSPKLACGQRARSCRAARRPRCARQRTRTRWRHGSPRQPGGRTRSGSASGSTSAGRRTDGVRGRRSRDRAGCSTRRWSARTDRARRRCSTSSPGDANLLPARSSAARRSSSDSPISTRPTSIPNTVVRELVAGPATVSPTSRGQGAARAVLVRQHRPVRARTDAVGR